jgi:multidrug resistance efflux pump
MRLTRGAVGYTRGQAKKASNEIDRQLRKIRREQDTLAHAAARLRKRGTPELTQLRRDATRTAEAGSRKPAAEQRLEQAGARVDELRQQLGDTNEKLERLMGGSQGEPGVPRRRPPRRQRRRAAPAPADRPLPRPGLLARAPLRERDRRPRPPRRHQRPPPDP